MFSRGMCRRHYRRAARGQALVQDVDQTGQPSGHGLYGELTGDGDTVLCHECGRELAALGFHVRRAHDLTARDYRLRHGLPLSQPLCSPALSAAARQNAPTPAAVLTRSVHAV